VDKLGDFKGDIIHSGQHPGVAPQQVPLWAEGNNVIFADQAVKVAPTQSPLYEKLSSLPGTGILAANNAGDPALVWGTREALYRGLTQPATEDVTRAGGAYTGTDSDLWSFAQFGQAILATNGVDKVQYLSDIGAAPGTNFVDIDGVSDLAAAFRCSILRKTAAFVIAYNTDNIDTEYRWCDEDDVLTWTPIAENKSRDKNIRELASNIVSVVDMGNTHIVYGRDQAFVIGFTGVPFYFGHQHLLDGIGAVGKHSVTPVGRRNFGFGPNGIFVADGASYQYIDTPSIHKYIYEDNFDSARGEETIAWADLNEQIAYFSFPSRDGAGLTVGFSWRTGAWALFDWYRKAASYGGMWQHPVVVDGTGQTWVQSATSIPYTSSGVPIEMSDSMELAGGYGDFGYGEAGYGGRWSGVG